MYYKIKHLEQYLEEKKKLICTENTSRSATHVGTYLFYKNYWLQCERACNRIKLFKKRPKKFNGMYSELSEKDNKLILGRLMFKNWLLKCIYVHTYLKFILSKFVQ